MDIKSFSLRKEAKNQNGVADERFVNGTRLINQSPRLIIPGQVVLGQWASNYMS